LSAVFDDSVLDALFDPGSLGRGRAYADDGRATVLASGPGAIDAVCRGSGQATYVVRLRWTERPGGRLLLDDTCTCPLGGGCKHCVAAILTARADSVLADAPSAPAATDWRRALDGLPLDESLEPSGDMALEIVLTSPPPSRFLAQVGPRPTVRALRRGKSGNWIKTGATWRDLASPQPGVGVTVDPLQRAALRSLMASGPPELSYSNTGTAHLDRFGPDLWFQLDRAVEVGVTLIGELPGDEVVLSPTRATATVDLAADGTGGVTLRVVIVHEGRPIEMSEGRSGLIGPTPHGLWTRDGGRIDLIGLTAPLHPTVARLLREGPVTVPARDVDELLDVYQPALARQAEVVSADGSVTITTTCFDGLVAQVVRTALTRADVRWFARYRRGERITDHALHGHGGRARERDAETAAIAALAPPDDVRVVLAAPDDPLGTSPGGPTGAAIRDRTVWGLEVATLLDRAVPWLRDAGVTVEVVDDLPALREAEHDPTISLVVSDADQDGRRDGNDWFDLHVEVSVDGQVVDFVTLFAALDRGDEVLVLPSGTWLRLDQPELVRLRELIAEARSLAEPGTTGAARLNRFQTSWWEELVALGVVADQSARWQGNVERMGALAAPEPVDPPATLRTTLRHYQQEGLDWLAFLHRHGLGGILADDMGLGKTVQTLALCLHVLEQDPDARFLVVAPTSVVENWAREAAQFAPGVEVRTIHETEKRRGHPLDDEIGDAPIVVTSYALFRLEFEQYARRRWDVLLLDEAQFVKNHQGKTHQCARRLDAATKVAVTGTPLENSLMDLWSLLSITAPGLFPDPTRFSTTYRKPIESGEAPELLATLRRRIAPLVRRRTKDAVLTELPPKTEQTVEVELSARHARIYETQLQRQRQKVLGLVGDLQKNRFEILKSLTLLRQLALDPALVDEADEHVGSAKLDRLLDDLTQVVAEGHRALVFSQFTRYLARLRTRLDAAGIEHSYLDGRTRRRDTAIARFRSGEVPVFVISLKAGGFGLNLTEADYCFVLDPWWNPATEAQAVDRTHRIGQQNPVMVYRYVSAGTIEEKVMELKAHKAELFSSVMDGDGALSGALTEDDVRGLLDLA